MDGRPTWTDCDEAGDYVDLVFRPDNMDETVLHHISVLSTFVVDAGSERGSRLNK